MYAVLRVRGPIKINKKIKRTLSLLNLTRANHCVLVKENKKTKGMLDKAKNYITWGEINKDILEKLLKKRGKAYNVENKLISIKESNYKIKDIIKSLLNHKKKLRDYNIKPVFRLKPPSKGYDRKGVKKLYKYSGVLGYRGKDINNLLKRMI